MKRILHLIDTGGPGGAETVYIDLIRGLNSQRWKSIPMLPNRDWMYEQLNGNTPAPILLASKRSFDLPYLFRLVRAIKRYDIDILHAHLLGPSVYGGLASVLCGIPLISTLHGKSDLAPGESFIDLKIRIINRASAQVVFVSESLRRYFLSATRLLEAGTAVIPNGIDPTAFRPRRDHTLRAELGIGNHAFLVGAVGNLRPAKDYFTFLHAAARLKKKRRGYKFVIVGQGDERLSSELSDLRRKLGLETDVHFTGFRNDVHRIMNNLDVYLLTSRSEGFSLSTIQALACATPVVATKCGGPEEIITDNENGLLVDVQSPPRIAEAVEKLRLDRALRERLGRAGQSHVNGNFSVQAQVRAYERLYEDSIHEGQVHCGKVSADAVGECGVGKRQHQQRGRDGRA